MNPINSSNSSHKYLQNHTSIYFINKSFGEFHLKFIHQNELNKINIFIQQLAFIKLENNRSDARTSFEQIIKKEIQNYGKVLKENNLSKIDFILTRYIHYFSIKKIFDQYGVSKINRSEFFEQYEPSPEKFLRTLSINYPEIFKNALIKISNSGATEKPNERGVRGIIGNYTEKLLLENKESLLALLMQTFDIIHFLADKAQFYHIMSTFKGLTPLNLEDFLSKMAQKLFCEHPFYLGQDDDLDTYLKRIAVIDSEQLATFIPQKSETYSYLKIHQAVAYVHSLRKNPPQPFYEILANSFVQLTKAHNFKSVIECIETFKKDFLRALEKYSGDLESFIQDKFNFIYPDLKKELFLNYNLKRKFSASLSPSFNLQSKLDPLIQLSYEQALQILIRSSNPKENLQNAYLWFFVSCQFYQNLKANTKNEREFLQNINNFYEQFSENQLINFYNFSVNSHFSKVSQHLLGHYFLLKQVQLNDGEIPPLINAYLKDFFEKNLFLERDYYDSVSSLQQKYLMSTLKEYTVGEEEVVYVEEFFPMGLKGIDELKQNFRKLVDPKNLNWNHAFNVCAQQFNGEIFKEIWVYLLQHNSRTETLNILNKASAFKEHDKVVKELWEILENFQKYRPTSSILTFFVAYSRSFNEGKMVLEEQTFPWILDIAARNLPNLFAFEIAFDILRSTVTKINRLDNRISQELVKSIKNYLEVLIPLTGSGKIFWTDLVTKQCRPIRRRPPFQRQDLAASEKKKNPHERLWNSFTVKLILVMLANFIKHKLSSQETICELLLDSHSNYLSPFFRKTAMNFILNQGIVEKLTESQTLNFHQEFLQTLQMLHADPDLTYQESLTKVISDNPLYQLYQVHPWLEIAKLANPNSLAQINKVFVQILRQLSLDSLRKTLMSILDFYAILKESSHYSVEYKAEIRQLLTFYERWLKDSLL